MDDLIKARIKEWSLPPFDSATISEIKKLSDAGNEKELTERFYTQLEFGTGGLRGVIGAGTNRMNIYTVGMATQGLSDYINSGTNKESGVVIARDSRRMSDDFAMGAAEIFAANGIQVFYFEDIMPTPLCSFAIRELGALSGIVITASHNPPEYNGYKVYWNDGGQIVPPYDKEIIKRVKEVKTISDIKKVNFSEAVKSGLIKITGPEIIEAYKTKLSKYISATDGSAIKIVYTPIHGTGYKIVPQMLSAFGYNNISIVKEQLNPDGNFPTVESPNPEEKKALQLALNLAEKENADIVLATDPDSDRMGVAVKDDSGNFILLNGNQIGTLLEYFILSKMKESGKLPEKAVVVKTIVTTELQRVIGEDFKCTVYDVLTGFKWIAAKMKEMEAASEKYIFGGEESFGYLPVDFVRDKDAVSACCFFAEMALWAKLNKTAIYGILKDIYTRYGLYLEDLHTITLKGLDGLEKIKSIMKKFGENPPEKIGDFKVEEIFDYKTLKIKKIADGSESKISGLPPSDVLQFYLSDGSKISMRPSGTEPKIKFYLSVNMKTSEKTFAIDKKALEDKLLYLKEELIALIN
jgi:phosphoglucomutase